MKKYINQFILAIKLANYQRLRKRRTPQRLAYQKWVAENESFNEEQIALLKSRYAALEQTPLISIIMPVYNAQIDWLKDAVSSVQNQVYKNWELCIADDKSSNEKLKPYLLSLAEQDPRIKVCFRPRNGHISAASNSAIEMANGDFLALMDQDDLIPPNALLLVAEKINNHPTAGIIYSDEDKVNADNLREAPTRKPGWDRNAILKYNSISHLGVFKTQLVRDIGGFKVGYEGSQDHDLALRCIEHLSDEQIIHIPEILYHWRIHADSTAHMQSAKPYALNARNRAIQDHISRTKNKSRI